MLLAGTLADLLSPARLVIFGTLLTTLNKPMFAASGYVFATFGTVSTLYWITAAKARADPPARQLLLVIALLHAAAVMLAGHGGAESPKAGVPCCSVAAVTQHMIRETSHLLGRAAY